MLKKMIFFLAIATMVLSLTACSCDTCGSTGEIVTCDRCKTGRVTVCYSCESGYERCEECYGKGYFLETCPSCDGDGYIINPYTWQTFDCSYCTEISGFLYYSCPNCTSGRLSAKCSKCDGNYTDVCPDCNGNYKSDCPDCFN